ncbi:MAG: ABC transporter permease [Gallicola sp.]|nr:ABC transporter permease [Gallicola sp.]
MKNIYLNLAKDGIRKNKEFYFPYILSSMGIIALFYIVLNLSNTESLKDFYGMGSLQLLLGAAVIVVGVFSLVFLFYTNNFLMKRRKKEFAIYSILGMEKKHLIRVLSYENILLSILTIVAGLVLGSLLYKLAEGLLFLLIDQKIDSNFLPSPKNLGLTAVLFIGLYLLIFINGVRQIQTNSPLKFLEESKAGEKPPKSNWVLGILGIVSLGIGYYLALSVENPLKAFMTFAVAVIFVMVGTYLCFLAVSTILLKGLQKSKNFYYKKRHFAAIAGLIFRIKNNAVGLANICIFATATLVLLSTGISFYAGGEDILRDRYPREVIINTRFDFSRETEDFIKEKTDQFFMDKDIKPVKEWTIHSLGIIGTLENGVLTPTQEGSNFSDFHYYVLVPQEDINPFLDEKINLTEGEALIMENTEDFQEGTYSIGNQNYRIEKEDRNFPKEGFQEVGIAKTSFIIVQEVEALRQVERSIGDEFAKVSYQYAFDFEENQEDKENHIQELKRILVEEREEKDVLVEDRNSGRLEFLSLYGGLFFTGIFLSLLFILATALSIYYKQLTEGLEDQKAFQIMEKVGMSDKEIKQTIRSQIRTVFFFPLIMSAVHMAFAYPMITKMLALLNMTNESLYAICIIGAFIAFSLFYYIVFKWTSRTYYKIVKG